LSSSALASASSRSSRASRAELSSVVDTDLIRVEATVIHPTSPAYRAKSTFYYQANAEIAACQGAEPLSASSSMDRDDDAHDAQPKPKQKQKSVDIDVVVVDSTALSHPQPPASPGKKNRHVERKLKVHKSSTKQQRRYAPVAELCNAFASLGEMDPTTTTSDSSDF
jgi:hypothetical protein